MSNPLDLTQHLIARERDEVNTRMSFLKADVAEMADFRPGRLRAHHVRGLIESMQEVHRYLIRIEAWEEGKS